MLPPFAPIENPLDLTTATISEPAIYGRAAQAILDDPGVGALLLSVIAGPLGGQPARFASLLPVIAQAQKPVVFAPFGDDAPLADELIDALRHNETLLFRSADRALRALARLDAYGRTIRALEAAGRSRRCTRVATSGTWIDSGTSRQAISRRGRNRDAKRSAGEKRRRSTGDCRANRLSGRLEGAS